MIDEEEIVYFRDIYDHVIRLTDELDNYRELAAATLDVYLTQVNNNLSVIMKRLTGVTVIVAGIGAVAGIFGMSEAGAALARRRGCRVLDRHRGHGRCGRRGGRRPAPDRLDLSAAESRRSAPVSLALDGRRDRRQHPGRIERRVEHDVGGRPDVVGHAVRAGHARPPGRRGRRRRARPAGRRTRRRRCCRRRRPRRSPARSSASSRSNASRLPPAVRGRRSTTSRPR